MLDEASPTKVGNELFLLAMQITNFQALSDCSDRSCKVCIINYSRKASSLASLLVNLLLSNSAQEQFMWPREERKA